MGKGTHKAVSRLQYFARRYRYVLRLDIVKHFPSMDHEVLFEILSKEISDPLIQQLIKTIIDSGKVVVDQDYEQHLFDEDDLLSLCRPRGLPIGNLTSQLWEWKYAIREKLAALRLVMHEHSAQVVPVSHGIPWLGFVVYPDYTKVKARKVVYTNRRLRSGYNAWQAGEISFAEFDARVQGWINHVRYADSWGLRRSVLKEFRL